MAVVGSRSSETKNDLLLSEVGVLQKNMEEKQRSFGQDKAPPQTRRAVTRVESAETQDYAPAPLTSCTDQNMVPDGEEEVEELSLVPVQSAIHAGPCTGVMAALVINLCKRCHNERRLMQGEEDVTASRWRLLVG